MSDSGREFYAELTDTWDEGICSFFVINEVLPHLQYRLHKGGPVPDFVMGIDDLVPKLKAWIESFAEPVTLLSDAPGYDWKWIEAIFTGRDWPMNLIRKCGNTLVLETDSERFRYNNALADFWRSERGRGAVQHHALWDARSIRFAHRYAMRGPIGQ